MAKFKVGDMVVLIGSKPKNAYSIGYDYEVIGYFADKAVIFNPDDLSENSFDKFAEGSWTAQENFLKLKTPPQEKSTWEEVEQITGWAPHKTKEAES